MAGEQIGPVHNMANDPEPSNISWNRFTFPSVVLW